MILDYINDLDGVAKLIQYSHSTDSATCLPHYMPNVLVHEASINNGNMP